MVFLYNTISYSCHHYFLPMLTLKSTNIRMTKKVHKQAKCHYFEDSSHVAKKEFVFFFWKIVHEVWTIDDVFKMLQQKTVSKGWISHHDSEWFVFTRLIFLLSHFSLHLLEQLKYLVKSYLIYCSKDSLNLFLYN